MKLVKRLIGASVSLLIVGCTQTAFPPRAASERPDPTPPSPTASVVFNKQGSPLPSPYLRDTPDDDDDYGAPQWEITKTYRSGKTKITATRQSGQTTEKYTSTEGPDGRTERRRVISTSGQSQYHVRP